MRACCIKREIENGKVYCVTVRNLKLILLYVPLLSRFKLVNCVVLLLLMRYLLFTLVREENYQDVNG